MTGALLRDVDDADLEVFYEQQREEEAVRRVQFPARDRDRFLTHWRTKVLGNPTGHVQTVTVDGKVAGNIVAWWQDGRRFVGYWFGQRFLGPAASGPRRCDSSCSASRSAPSTPTRSWATPPRCGSLSAAASRGEGPAPRGG